MSSQTAVQIPALDFATVSVRLGTMAGEEQASKKVAALQACQCQCQCQASQAAANVPCQA